MNKFVSILICLQVLSAACGVAAAELHVALSGNDGNDGSAAKPFRTISAAAAVAQPGDAVTVHGGIYRERVAPPRGGESDAKRIVYQAAQGEQVEIRGSEVIRGWANVQGDVWKVTLPNTFFGTFNPYNDLIRGDWFSPKGREHHTGAVYTNGMWLTEAANLDEVLAPANTDSNAFWYSRVHGTNTTIWARFKGLNPNEQEVEINVRQAVFYPEKPGVNFITVRGFALRHAATPWAPPTAEQVGLIGTHWSRGWVIENNTISHSTCSGVSLGKHGDEYDNTSANTAGGYVKTIERAHAFSIPWTRENIGHHVVRSNRISHCEQAGIVGSLGCSFSTVTGNVIHDIHVRRLFSGAEQAGIKFHAAIDVTVSGNHIYRTLRGLWLDWMAQGTRVSGNLFHDNLDQDLFVEVDHGPFLVDNNIFLSKVGLLDMSEGGAYVHNLWVGKINCLEEPTRETPYHPAHSTVVAGLKNIRGGDNRFYNNVFVGLAGVVPQVAGKDDRYHRRVGYGLWVYDGREQQSQVGGNVYLNGARPYTNETAVVEAGRDPGVALVEEGGSWYIQFNAGPELKAAATVPVTTALLGKAKVPGLSYENADGSPITVDTDYFGVKRDAVRPAAGPFEKGDQGNIRIKVY